MGGGGHALVARLDSDGDMLLAGPAIRAVAERSDRVTVLAGRRGRNAAGRLPGVDGVVVWDAPWIDPRPGAARPGHLAGGVAAVAAVGADRAVILTSRHQSALPTALLLRMAGVPFIAAISEDYPGSLLDVRHPPPGDVHEVERMLSLVLAAGYGTPSDGVGLRVRRDPDALPEGLPDRYVVVHPGASVRARAWPAERHAALVGALASRGVPVVVTGGPDEVALTARVAAGAGPGVHDLGGRTDLAALTEVLAGAAAVVVGNTGPAHLAAAVGTPVAWLHAPTVPAARWRPWRVPHERLAVDVPCAGCRARDCPVPRHPCMSGVGVDRVLEAVDRLAFVPTEAEEPVCAS